MTSRVSAEEIVAAYQATGSVWKAAKQLGLAGQTVHERLRALGYPLTNRNWIEEDDAELRALLAAGVTAGEAAHRLGRTFAGVTSRMNELGVRSRKRAKERTLPRGAGYDKVSIGRHLSALEASGMAPTRYCRAHGLNIDSFVYACQQQYADRWAKFVAATSSIEERTCPYCERAFVPTSGKQTYCTRKCGNDARVDAAYFGGNRRSTIGLAEGVCQLCGAAKRKGMSSHHVVGKENDPDNANLIALCAGCHKVVTLLASRTFVDDPSRWETLISLAWLRRHGADVAAGRLDGQALYTYVEIEVDVDDEASVA